MPGCDGSPSSIYGRCVLHAAGAEAAELRGRRGPKAPPIDAVAHRYLQSTLWAEHEAADAPGMAGILRRRALCERIVQDTTDEGT
jgi:hypothetical protein